MLETFVKTYGDRRYRFPTMLRHGGVVLAFAMDDRRRIFYSVLDLAGAKTPMDVDAWLPNPKELSFATELAQVGFGAADQAQLPRVKLGSSAPVASQVTVDPAEVDTFLSSTARLTAAVPFQVVSDGPFLYVFRQALTDPSPSLLADAEGTLTLATADPAARADAQDLVTDHANMAYVTDAAGKQTTDPAGRPVPLVNGTLLVDRFVLVGTDLQPKLQVRYQRSRSRTRPASRTDSVGATDLDGHPFVEPTQELRFVTGVDQGRFTALLVPSVVADVHRWQIFTADAEGALWSYSVEQAADGLFNTRGSQPWTCTDHPDVFSPAPGQCPRPSAADATRPCGKDLVPLSDRDGAAGSALAFSGDGDRIELTPGAALGGQFTIEAWVRPKDGATGEHGLVGSGADPAHASPSLWIVDGTKVKAGFGDGSTLRSTTSPALLQTDAWHHVAASFDGTWLTVSVDGLPLHATRDLAGALPVATPVSVIGSPSGSFAGRVDEIRLWRLARPAGDIRTGMNVRLSGLEPELAAYWRLDEGSGTRVWDQAAGATGAVVGPTWVTSDAPIGEGRGLRRTALRLTGRRPAGGLDATLYYLQEAAPSGYDGRPKPQKGSARIMLTAVTAADGDAGRVAALDFAVGPDGRPADLPTEVGLSELSIVDAGGRSPNELLDQLATAAARVADLEADIASTRQIVTDLTNGIASADSALHGRRLDPLPTGAAADLADLSYDTIVLLERVGFLAAVGVHTPALDEAQKALQPLLAELSDGIASHRGDLARQQAALAAHEQELAAARADLADLRQQVNGDVALPMPLLHLDARGLSVAGAVLGFAPTADPPVLFESALGRLGLYFRGDGGQLSAAYYSTSTGRSQQVLDAGSGTVVAFVARAAEPELDTLTVTVAPGPDDHRCTLTAAVTLPAGNVTETWQRLPRDAQELAAILNGTAPAPVPIGAAAGAAGKIDQLELRTPLRAPLPGGTLLQAGTAVVTVAAATAKGATAVPVEPEEVTIPAGATVSRVAYDYAGHAATTLAGARIDRTSLLLAADARAATGEVELGTAAAGGQVPSARWYGATPGTTLDYTGQTVAGVFGNSALHFDGAHDSVAIPAPAKSPLDVTDEITMEAWIRPTATDGVRDIVARGPVADPPGEVLLRLRDGTYEAGSWTGVGHKASAPVPAGDVGSWVHLAGVYDGSSWLLYRNGVLLAAAPDATGPVPVAAGWAVGSATNGTERFFAGDVDEVRIWRRARTAQELTDNLGRRLAGTEAGLVGYWYAVNGTFTDHSAGNVDGTLRGAPQPAASPPALSSITGLDAARDVTVEAWVRPGAAVDPGEATARLVQHRSDTSSYLLALRSVRSALSFDGTSQYFTVDGGPALDLTGQVTLEAWVLPTRTDGLRYIVAHGLLPNSPPVQREVALRINNGVYQAGSYDGHDHYAVWPIPADDVGHWVHLAGVYDGTAWRLYHNGQLRATQNEGTGAVSVAAAWALGGSATGERFFAGSIGEVRLWNRARGPEEISGRQRRWLTGAEDGLVACWRYNGSNLVDYTPGARTPKLHGTGAPSPADGPVPGYRAVAGAGTSYLEAVEPFAGDDWTHLALVYSQAYALHVGGVGAYLDAGARTSLDLGKDVTVEVTVALDDLNAPQALVSKGRQGSGDGRRVPYALAVATNGAVVFSFEDTDGKSHSLAGDAGAVQPGGVRRIAVTRKRVVTLDTQHAGAVVAKWDEISYFVDGVQKGSQTYSGTDAGSSSDALLIGRSYADDGSEYSLRGTLVEVRLWSTARTPAGLGGVLTGNELGLVAWWRLREAAGNVAADAKGGNAATMRGAVSWVKTPEPGGSALRLHRDGVPVATRPPSAPIQPARNGFSLGSDSGPTPGDRLHGQLEEVRIWKAARTTEQLQDNLFRRLTGEQDRLIAYYTFDAEPGARVPDNGMLGNDLSVVGGSYVPSTAPVAEDAPQVRNAVAGLATDYTTVVGGRAGVAEYADTQPTPDGQLSGVFKRAYTFTDPGGAWRLVTGFKVGDMTAEWVGQAQFDPQLVGYVEGAPPVPSENLTVKQDGYQGASSVTLTDATKTTYTYATSRNAGLKMSLEASNTVGFKTDVTIGVLEIEAPLGVGVAQQQASKAIDADAKIGGTLSIESDLSWQSSVETGTGNTLTQVSGLELTGRPEPADHPEYPAVGPRWVPDNVGLALVQSQTADVFALRLAHTGALIAYQMRPNPDIPRDWNLITFPINPQYTKQGTLDGKVGLDPDREDYPNALTYSSDVSYFKPIEAYQYKAQVIREEQELATLFAQYQADPGGVSQATSPKPAQPVKRNLANTYVWTADGGRFAETEETLDTRSETVGGSFSFAAMAGIHSQLELTIMGASVAVDLTAKAGGHLELEVHKTQASERSFALDVQTAPERDLTTADATGARTRQPGKVDAYRFMSFYLAPQTGFHDLFFTQVVDPLWLAQSGDRNAAALRQAHQPDKRPACWRVFHRVTYVSRVLPPLDEGPAASGGLDRALQTLDIDSNYELIKALEPYVQGHTASYGDLAGVVRQAVTSRLPDLSTHIPEILSFLALYYGVPDAPAV